MVIQLLRGCVLLIALMVLPIQIWSAPAVSGVSPYYGPSAGGTVVTITGSGFTGTTTVAFGQTTVAPTSVSDTMIQVTSPVHVPQSVFVTVNTSTETSAPSPNAYFVYQGNWTVAGLGIGGTLNLINLSSSPSIEFTTDLEKNLDAVAFTPDGSQVYCLPANQGDNNNIVYVVDVASYQVVGSITLPGVTTTTGAGIVFHPNGLTAYISNSSNNSVQVVNTSDFSVQTVSVGQEPFQLTILPNGSQVFVSNNNDNEVAVIDTETLAVSFVSIPDANSRGIASIVASPDGLSVYVVAVSYPPLLGYLYVIDVVSLTATEILTLPAVGGYTSSSLAMSPDGQYVFVSNNGSTLVSVIATSPTPHFVTNITLSHEGPGAMIVTPDSVGLYVPSGDTTGGNGYISYIPLASLTETEVITVTGLNYFNSICTTPNGNQLYVSGDLPFTVGAGMVEINNTDPTGIYGVIPLSNANDINNITADQAPLARFSATVLLDTSAGTILFDATKSLSPVGAIVSYLWDFGDGSTPQETTEPLITHRYLNKGMYSAALTVTNSAGTSITKKYNHASYWNGYALYNPALLNNGGLSAQMQQDIVIAAPVVTGIDPHSGCEKGGKKVTITGSHFAGATSVHFGKHKSRSFEIVSDTVIIATVPEGEGKVKVVVHSPFGKSVRSVHYSYKSCHRCTPSYKVPKRYKK